MPKTKFRFRKPIHYSIQLKTNVINKDFKKIIGLDLPLRKTNFIYDGIVRRDCLFSYLTQLYFFDQKKFKAIQDRIGGWAKETPVETTLSLGGYICYLIDDFKNAKIYFLKTLALNPDNLDNWYDLAFALRHLGEIEESRAILFHFDLAIYYYKKLCLNKMSYFYLKKLLNRISENAD